jgi:hypothetical protein
VSITPKRSFSTLTKLKNISQIKKG